MVLFRSVLLENFVPLLRINKLHWSIDLFSLFNEAFTQHDGGAGISKTKFHRHTVLSAQHLCLQPLAA